MVDEIENYDDSMSKCKQISKIIPKVCQSIKEIQQLDKTLGFDFNLKLAERLLAPLDTIASPQHETDKIIYINDYRDNLTHGLTSLASFFNTLTNLEDFTDDQRSRMSLIAANIVISQNSISKIAAA